MYIWVWRRCLFYVETVSLTTVSTVSSLWSCNCYFSFLTGWNMPIIVKRLDARYDWLTARWDQRTYRLADAGSGCDPSPSVAGAVAWVSEGSCSFFTKVCECHWKWSVLRLVHLCFTDDIPEVQQNNIQQQLFTILFIVIIFFKSSYTKHVNYRYFFMKDFLWKISCPWCNLHRQYIQVFRAATNDDFNY